jgi:8-oxo-dGTP pyrophosphatase MutT (NUDIX family)
MTAPGSDELTIRNAGRVVLLDDRDRILLFRFEYSLDPAVKGRAVWITPGGGLEPGESPEEGARRELREETGLRAELGPLIWTRRHAFPWQGGQLEQRESYYLVRTRAFEVDRENWTAEEHVVMTRHRWWALEELHANAENDYFAPRRLAELLGRIVAGDIPAAPIDVGV